MTSFNKTILLGNLTRDPEIRYTANEGLAVAQFSIAVNEKKKDATGAYKDKVDYFDIIVFGKQAENCGQYVFKGDAVLIEGKLQQRRWQDKDTGANRSKVEVVAQHVTFMPRKARAGDGTTGRGGADVPPAVGNAFPDATSVGEEDIPF